MKQTVDVWKRKESRRVADCRVFEVREDFCERNTDGKRQNFFVVECPDWVNVIAVTANNEVVLIEQYRQGSEEITLEIPGGMIDGTEEPAAAASRELLEETGYTAREIISLGKSRPNPAINTNWIHHFLAVGCEPTGATGFDEHESLLTVLARLDEIPRLIAEERITHSLAVAAFYKMKNRGEDL